MPDVQPLAHATAAVVVVYRLATSIEPLLAALAGAVGEVVIVDNAELGHEGLDAVAARHGADLIRGANRGGVAGAYNRALAHLRGRPGPTCERVVFLDEDSDPSGLAAFLADDRTMQLLADPLAAAVAPVYRDRATGLRGKYIELERLRLSFLPRDFAGPRRVAFVINSMSVWRRQALDRIGPFDERLAIDHVDTEYCLRARQAGLAVWVHGDHEFAHTIGQRRRYRLLGRELQAGGHAPARRYLIGRNTSWLARSWAWREPAFAFLCLTRLIYEGVGIVMAEDQVGAKLAALVRGALAGLFMPRHGAAASRAAT